MINRIESQQCPVQARTPRVLLCFAMRLEAAPVERALSGNQDFVVRTVGMGPKNARAAIRRALDEGRPDVVLTCGLAGGLRVDLAVGDIVFETADPALAQRLRGLGAQPVQFWCSDRVACLAEEKAGLRASTGADAVEMESGVIQAECKQRGLRCATVRIVSDRADEDLPLDFNAVSQAGGDLELGKLARALLRSPGRIVALARFQRTAGELARRLATFLVDGLLPQLSADANGSV